MHHHVDDCSHLVSITFHNHFCKKAKSKKEKLTFICTVNPFNYIGNSMIENSI
ncbi:hypothetical protein SLEP1_g11573 [Rubroshorea leprosula]|nr:hypothetical protein SLEP1_g11573 [Rubroshorea leprosula]